MNLASHPIGDHQSLVTKPCHIQFKFYANNCRPLITDNSVNEKLFVIN